MSAGKRRRLPGLRVRPGSIKRARGEAGLSLAQVASGEVSRTAVYLAETGKTRPTLPTIQLIATRTGKPLEYFLLESPGVPGSSEPSGRLAVDELRELAAAEKFTELAQAAERAKEAASERVDKAWAGFFLAQAQIRLANPHAALIELEEARATFQAEADKWMVVECTDWLSAGLYLLEDSTAFACGGSESCGMQAAATGEPRPSRRGFWAGWGRSTWSGMNGPKPSSTTRSQSRLQARSPTSAAAERCTPTWAEPMSIWET